MLTDGILTQRALAHGSREIDPAVTPFLGSHPRPAVMYAAGAVVCIGEAYLAERMHRSRHRWIRRMWWLPQTVTIGASAYGIQSSH